MTSHTLHPISVEQDSVQLNSSVLPHQDCDKDISCTSSTLQFWSILQGFYQVCSSQLQESCSLKVGGPSSLDEAMWEYQGASAHQIVIPRKYRHLDISSLFWDGTCGKTSLLPSTARSLSALLHTFRSNGEYVFFLAKEWSALY